MLKQVLGYVGVVVMMLGAAPSAYAVNPNCEKYDLTGANSVGEPVVSFFGDGQITLGTTPWWQDDLGACYQTYFEPGYLPYFSACDFDESGAVDLSEVLELYNFILDYPVPGTNTFAFDCSTPTCEERFEYQFDYEYGWDVGETYLGAAVLMGQCDEIYGDSIPEGIELFPNLAACQEKCNTCQSNDDCTGGAYCHFMSTNSSRCGNFGTGTCVMPGDYCSETFSAATLCTCDLELVEGYCEASLAGVSGLVWGDCSLENLCEKTTHNAFGWDPVDQRCNCGADRVFDESLGCVLVHECLSDVDCDNGEVCGDNQCHECTINSHCSANEVCYNNRCMSQFLFV